MIKTWAEKYVEVSKKFRAGGLSTQVTGPYP
jgi:hypothetical protein